jgi:AraC-like DNA-binding protein
MIYASTGSSITTLDNQEFLLEDGDLFLSFPNQIHFYYDQRPLDGYMVIFSPDMFRDLKEDFHNKRPTYPVIKRHQLPSDIRARLAVITEKNASDSPYDRICAKGHLLALLGDLIPLMDLVPVSADHDSIKNLMNYCSENYTENLTLDSVSKELHLSKFYISHIFKERMNIGFTDFINSLRTEHACELLKKDVSITDVAFSSGFSSIRTFNRVFLENMGMTPRDYIKTKQG